MATLSLALPPPRKERSPPLVAPVKTAPRPPTSASFFTPGARASLVRRTDHNAAVLLAAAIVIGVAMANNKFYCGTDSG